jgi:SAM-dependent MidA family methyltransferase
LQTFSSYFNDWLFGANGYYSSIEQVGAKGDFVTSVTTSGFFGATVANYFLKRIKDGFFSVDDVWFVELGANRGLAIKDVIRFIAGEEPELIKELRFCAIEPLSADELKQNLKDFDFGQKELKVVHSLSEICAKEAFIFANEVLDCQPCELLYNGKFATVLDNKIEFNTNDKTRLEYASKYDITKGEVPVGVDIFAKQFCGIKSEILFFDYGQNFARNDFSIRVYKNHKTNPLFEFENLEEFFAKSDITYDVHFGIWQDEFEKLGFRAQKLKNQSRALIDFGIDALIGKMLACVDEKTAFEQLRRIKTLIAPEGFGERFKLLHLRSGK